jgi:hypothetical protein
MLAVLVMVGGLFLSREHTGAPQTANQLQALQTMPTVAEDTFSEPQEIVWEGRVARIFVGGEGLEIFGPSIPGGAFQAYMPQGEVSPVTEGSVKVRGLWKGYTCAYGGHDGACVPEVDIISVEALPIELE